MDFLEKDLEDILWSTYNASGGRELLIEKGICITGKLYRQVNLQEYGILDLLSVYILDDIIYVEIYELKQKKY